MGGTAEGYSQVHLLEIRGLESGVPGGLPERFQGRWPAGPRLKETCIVLQRWAVVLGPSAQLLKGI